MTPLIQKLRSAGEAERTLAPASGLFDAAADEIERLMMVSTLLRDATMELASTCFDAAEKWQDAIATAARGGDNE